MPIRLIPFTSDPESDIETQIAVMGAIIAGNLMSVAVLQSRLTLQRCPEARDSLPPVLEILPKISVGLFLAASLYFLALSWRDAREGSSTQLQLVLYANLLATAAVFLKTRVVFQAPPESTASVGAVEP